VRKSDLGWKAVTLVAGAAAAFVTQRVLHLSWRATKGGDPPENPAAKSTSWPDAVGWAVASGVALAVSRLVAQRGAAAAWKKTTGHYPRALEEAS
jgi:hypothetical protein